MQLTASLLGALGQHMTSIYNRSLEQILSKQKALGIYVGRFGRKCDF